MARNVKIIIGTRPQIIKLTSLAGALDREGVDFSIIHTGQHYDFEMNQIFFDELNIPTPETHLGVCGGSHLSMTAAIMAKLETALEDADLVAIPGDTNSALAGGLAAAKMGIRVGHVEAGLRSWDRSMPEEINRVLVDHLSEMLFAPTIIGYENLIHEGVSQDKVHQTGDVTADNVQMLKPHIGRAEFPISPPIEDFAYATIHRTENVDRPENLRNVVRALSKFRDRHGFDVLIPLHPHTRKSLEKLNLLKDLSDAPGVNVVKPVGYLTSLKLANEAKVVLTDSGGLQKEAFILGTPTVTIRTTTEWCETVETGWSRLTGSDPERIHEAVEEFLQHKLERVDPMKFYGEGNASKRIAELLREAL
ncbi:MAG: UDP-N-acetylglucosamine 2-epimerase (non-hydrolyzing) [Methanobacteriota archaeon]|nr:MAG: UDP-N-acetylglucosamine 2-epimerase (non-hydrolyzing) [Euryarchaeota archaeon]